MAHGFPEDFQKLLSQTRQDTAADRVAIEQRAAAEARFNSESEQQRIAVRARNAARRNEWIDYSNGILNAAAVIGPLLASKMAPDTSLVTETTSTKGRLFKSEVTTRHTIAQGWNLAQRSFGRQDVHNPDSSAEGQNTGRVPAVRTAMLGYFGVLLDMGGNLTPYWTDLSRYAQTKPGNEIVIEGYYKQWPAHTRSNPSIHEHWDAPAMYWSKYKSLNHDSWEGSSERVIQANMVELDVARDWKGGLPYRQPEVDGNPEISLMQVAESLAKLAVDYDIDRE